MTHFLYRVYVGMFRNAEHLDRYLLLFVLAEPYICETSPGYGFFADEGQYVVRTKFPFG